VATLPPGSSLESTLRALASDFAARVIALTRAESIDSISAVSLGGRAAPTPTEGAAVPRPFAPAERGKSRATDLVDRMVELVETMPWPARSRELQALLGISKDRFLRVANLALDMKLVHRIGQKGGVKYLPLKKRGPRPG